MGVVNIAGSRIKVVVLLIVILTGIHWAGPGESDGQEPLSTEESIENDVGAQSAWWEDMTHEAYLVRYETAALFAGITAVGIYSWNWGSSGFRTNSEGWFRADTGSGGADKLGHAFTAYAFANLLTEAIYIHGGSSPSAPLTASVLSMGLMTYVEMFDGFSEDHGFSYEDMVLDALGVGLAYARHRIPGLRDLLDFRMEYWPSGYKGFRPLSDYSGMRYLLAFKLSGIELSRKNPLRYLELHTGYYTRGFFPQERADGKLRERTPYVGIGLNLNELFFGHRPKDSPELLDRARRLVFEHIQVPYTSYRFYENTKQTR